MSGKKKVVDKSIPVFEVPAIRLSADETRLVLRARGGALKNMSQWHMAKVVELGLFTERKIKHELSAEEIAELWVGVSEATATQAIGRLDAAVARLHKGLDRKPEIVYELTEIGKELARGLTVRLSAR